MRKIALSPLSRRTICCVLVLAAWLPLRSIAQTTQPTTQPTTQSTDPRRWEKAIVAFEEKDRTNPPPKDAVLFVGSSSIVRWKLDESFPGLVAINRGFGGSFVADSLFYVERVVLPYRPAKIVFYAGENDISAGKSPRRVADDFQQFVARVRGAQPEVPIIFVGLKPSPIRFHLIEKFRETNRLINQFISTQKNITFVDVEKPMLDAEGRPRQELFVADRLHLSPEGYQLWNQIIRPLLWSPPAKPVGGQ
jgi:lysophospholipase L1-like esterase